MIVVLLMELSLIASGQNLNLRHYYQQGTRACKENRYKDCLTNFKAANQLRPNHQLIMYHLARAFSFNSDTDSSAYYLKKSLIIKADFDLADSAFNSWSSSPRFMELVAFQKDQMSPVNLSEPIVRLTDRSLHIESVAYDPVEHQLYLGSVHKQKILKVDLNHQTIRDFKATEADGLWSVFGMKVDASKRHLWACSVATNLMIQADSTLEGLSAVYKFDLDSGEVISRYILNDSANHWFGDLTLSPDGEAFISDSKTNTIYTIGPDNEEMVPFFHTDHFLSLQGLDVIDNGKYLMIADYVSGLYRLDLTTKRLAKLKSKLEAVSLKSVDGLYVYQNSLVVTQNQVVPMRVTRYFLNQDRDIIIDYRYLEKGNPLLNEPTLGVLVDNWFYYVANSQWGGYDKQNKPLPYHQLQDIHILKVRID